MGNREEAVPFALGELQIQKRVAGAEVSVVPVQDLRRADTFRAGGMRDAKVGFLSQPLLALGAAYSLFWGVLCVAMCFFTGIHPQDAGITHSVPAVTTKSVSRYCPLKNKNLPPTLKTTALRRTKITCRTIPPMG